MKTLALAPTREQARNFIRKAKQLGVEGFNQPIKAYGVWFVEVKPRPVLTLKKQG
jgi:hypothetical protein